MTAAKEFQLSKMTSQAKIAENGMMKKEFKLNLSFKLKNTRKWAYSILAISIPKR